MKGRKKKVSKAEARASSAEFFAEESARFSHLLVHALTVSNAIGRQIAKPQKGYASWLYMRACVIARSMEQLFTPAPPVHGKFTYLDYASLAALSRALIETVTVQLYIGDITISEEEWALRNHIIDLHDHKNRTMFLNLVGHKSENEEPEENYAYVTERVTSNPLFSKLNPALQKKILDGDEMFVTGRHKAMLKIGWSDKETRGIYKYLSIHAHAQSMSFHRIEANGLYTHESLAAKGTAAFVTAPARSALGVACVSMIDLFPETELSFDELVLASLRSEYKVPA